MVFVFVWFMYYCVVMLMLVGLGFLVFVLCGCVLWWCGGLWLVLGVVLLGLILLLVFNW